MTALYRRLITGKTETVLDALHRENNSTGTTPDDDLDVLAGLVMAAKARRILQFGTFLGGSALVLADLAKQNATPEQPARLLTLDTAEAYNEICRSYAKQAGLDDVIQTLTGSSLDPAIIKQLAADPWDVIYLDTTHQFFATRDEILSIVPLCGEHTLFLFHDASSYAADTLDTQRQGGVKRAIREFCTINPRWGWMIFERPAFGQFGIGLMQKRVK